MIMLISKRLGENIKKIRTRKGMSQGDICRALDMERGYMSAIENGKKNITIQQLERLAQALSVSVDKLLK
jgi:transcriptional regulator with XRE-family HTH domain